MGRGEPLTIALQHACSAGFQHAAGSAKAACQKVSGDMVLPALIQPYA